MTRSYRVLIADDDSGCLESISTLLSQEGFLTRAVGGGEQVLECLRQAPTAVHFLVIDYHMPDLTGLEVLRIVRLELKLSLPSIVMSGDFSQELENVVRAQGGFALVPKPVEPIHFRRIVRRLVENLPAA